MGCETVIVLTWGRAAFSRDCVTTDMRSLRQLEMVCLWRWWFADETVVVVKSQAYEDMVTYLRIKLVKRDKDVKGEGWNILIELQ